VKRRTTITAAFVFFSVMLQAQTAFLGYDRNEYPGDVNLIILHKTFSYTGYWLNNPPGAKENTWAGHRGTVEAAGFGFLVLFNGRLYVELKSVANAKRLGKLDAKEAVSSARTEGFPGGTVIFLDQEQGGRMLPEQKAYIYAWVDGVNAAGLRAGIYCSGIAAKDDGNVVTAEDIRQNAGMRQIVYWAINDACPPAPGCIVPARTPSALQSGVSFAEVWQFAQSPQRKDVAGHCTNYSHDGNCYAPAAPGIYVDLNVATTADPSHGRNQ
jgi:glycoside hydrolase-like protein